MAVKYKASENLNIEVCTMKARELQPGDLFSMAAMDYWEIAIHGEDGCVGQKIYVRTFCETPPEQEDIEVYRLRFVQTKGV